MNTNIMFASISAIILYIGLYLHRKCDNPEPFDQTTCVYSIITGIVVFVGLNYYKPTGESGMTMSKENIMTEPF